MKQKTRVENATTDPLYYETLEFHEMLPHDLHYAPEVVLTVWDAEMMGLNSQVGLCRFDLSKVKPKKSDTAPPPSPEWIPLEDLNGGPTCGAVLVSFQLIQKRDLGERFGRPMPIQPAQMSSATFVEIIALGVRDMQPFNFAHIGEPFARFDVPGMDGTSQTFITQASRHPRGRDANFLQKDVMTVCLPVNASFAPTMSIRVYDKRLSGLAAPLVGESYACDHTELLAVCNPSCNIALPLTKSNWTNQPSESLLGCRCGCNLFDNQTSVEHRRLHSPAITTF